MDNFGFTTGSALGGPALILCLILAAIVAVWLIVGIARGRRDDPE